MDEALVPLPAGPALCLPRPSLRAPPRGLDQLSELARYLYREHEAVQPEVLEQGLANLQSLLNDVDLGDLWRTAWILGPQADLEGSPVQLTAI